ncbi:hypothetical protein ACIBFB_04310 [Nocardiopsis sp. NPDC050513]|uniref:hypothetical protein n=1 Tax=Nocardiopsis sp. NPDC050513 TaxID=3364338 RepID=UPI0037A462A6
MRKHHTRWVALLGAATLSTTGLTGLAGPAVAADDKDPRVMSWPMVEQAISSYKLDGFEIGYLPPGLDRYGINASSLLDRRGNSQSQISWVQGPDQLYGRVTVLRSEQVQKLEDLRELRYSHLPERGLERVGEAGDVEREAYVSEATGDMFWMVEPGVAVATHLRPERWDGDELRRMAESVVELTDADVEEGQEEDAESEAQDGAEETGDAAEAAETGEDEAAEEGESTGADAPGDTDTAAEESGETEESEEAAEQDAGTAEGEAGEAAEESAAGDEEAEQAQESDAFDGVEVTEASIGGAPEEAAGESEGTAESAGEPAEEDAGQDTGTDQGDAAEEADTGSGLPEGVSARRVKQCLIEEFVVFEYIGTDREGTGRAPGEGVERPLTREQLTDQEQDQLLASVWYHGTEDEKDAATDHCADSLDVERTDVESVLGQISDLIAQLVREAEQSATEGMDQVTVASETLAPGLGGAGGLEPMDDAEWEELWNSLPWAFEITAP